jgi:hypothetical protein
VYAVTPLDGDLIVGLEDGWARLRLYGLDEASTTI